MQFQLQATSNVNVTFSWTEATRVRFFMCPLVAKGKEYNATVEIIFNYVQCPTPLKVNQYQSSFSYHNFMNLLYSLSHVASGPGTLESHNHLTFQESPIDQLSSHYYSLTIGDYLTFQHFP